MIKKLRALRELWRDAKFYDNMSRTQLVVQVGSTEVAMTSLENLYFIAKYGDAGEVVSLITAEGTRIRVSVERPHD